MNIQRFLCDVSLDENISPSLFCLFVLLGGSFVDAAKVEVIEVPSAKMEKKVPATVILPDAYSKRGAEKFPVLYLLHGAGGNHASWNQSTQCAQLADKYEFIILCPMVDRPVGTTTVPSIRPINMRLMWPRSACNTWTKIIVPGQTVVPAQSQG